MAAIEWLKRAAGHLLGYLLEPPRVGLVVAVSGGLGLLFHFLARHRLSMVQGETSDGSPSYWRIIGLYAARTLGAALLVPSGIVVWVIANAGPNAGLAVIFMAPVMLASGGLFAMGILILSRTMRGTSSGNDRTHPSAEALRAAERGDAIAGSILAVARAGRSIVRHVSGGWRG